MGDVTAEEGAKSDDPKGDGAKGDNTTGGKASGQGEGGGDVGGGWTRRAACVRDGAAKSPSLRREGNEQQSPSPIVL